MIRCQGRIPHPHLILIHALTDTLRQIGLYSRSTSNLALDLFLLWRGNDLGIKIPAFVLVAILLVTIHLGILVPGGPGIELLSAIHGSRALASIEAVRCAAIGQSAVKEALAEVLDWPVGFGLVERDWRWG
jgi:hypothetical protein